MNEYHVPVMLNEVLQYLDVKPGNWYIDCNLGGGGHTEGILQKGGRVIGIDLDRDAIKEVAKKHKLEIRKTLKNLQAYSDNLIIYQGNFAKLKEIMNSVGDNKYISGILFDLGVSTHQLQTPTRGFSFNKDSPLDMRMDPINQEVKASNLINGLYEKELALLFWKLGEERFSRQIAKKIVKYRQRKKIDSTNELASIILSVRHRSPNDRTHPATRVFQALRIAVNDELNALKSALPQTLELLQPGGRLVVISFHSLEDRITKDYFRDWGKQGKVKIITKKPLETSEEEILLNPRARSAKLRVVEKI